MRRSVENGRNFKSFRGFRISCKSSTCLSTFVTAILSALLVMIMHGKSFFIMTSLFEGFGMVLLEATQYKLPLISYDINYGPKEIIENGVNGYLVESGNIDLLSEKISEFIDNADKRRIMSNMAYISLNRFDERNITNQWIELFEALA